MYQNILVPLLFGEDHPADMSLTAAQKLAGEGAKITLIHVIEEVPAYVTAYIPDNQMSAVVDDAHAALAKIADALPGATATVIRGHASRSLLEFAEANGVDCIIVNSHKPGLQDYLLGGTAARLVRHAQCAVHVIR